MPHYSTITLKRFDLSDPRRAFSLFYSSLAGRTALLYRSLLSAASIIGPPSPQRVDVSMDFDFSSQQHPNNIAALNGRAFRRHRSSKGFLSVAGSRRENSTNSFGRTEKLQVARIEGNDDGGGCFIALLPSPRIGRDRSERFEPSARTNVTARKIGSGAAEGWRARAVTGASGWETCNGSEKVRLLK